MESKLLTFSVDGVLLDELRDIKQTFFNDESWSEMIRCLIEKGLESKQKADQEVFSIDR